MPLSGLAPLLLCALPSWSAGQASSDTLRLVDYVLETEVADLAPEPLGVFMELDPGAVPRDKRRAFLAKREEILALRRVAEGSAKPPLRRLGAEAPPRCEPEPGSDFKLSVLRLAGYAEIEERELDLLIDRTRCDECELQTEFTLRVLTLPPAKKGGKPRRKCFLHHKDPVWTLVGHLRETGGDPGGTEFFGIGVFPKCR